MPRTFNEHEQAVLTDLGADPTFAGMQTFNTGQYRFWDTLGIFNPRQFWSNLIDGPDQNWAGSLYKTINYVTGTVFPTTIGWYLDSARTKPVVVKTYNYSGTAYTVPTSLVWTLYNASGTVIHTCTDTITYVTGTVLESTRTRTIT